jgi:hypothetical protein
MSCDEFYYRHVHKKITHKHAHSNDIHHRHTHSDGLNGQDHSAIEPHGDPEHLHEHTHEAAEHQHASEHDPLHLCNEPGMKNQVTKQKKTEVSENTPLPAAP